MTTVVRKSALAQEASDADHLEPAVGIEGLRSTLARVIRGKAEVIDRLLTGLLAGGHVLIEDVPGVGKTTLAKALARAVDVDFCRVQFTPDLLPSDILGAQIFSPKDGTFSFQPGPIFTNVLLADEVNRASPRTQAALLEAMNEGQVTGDGISRPLPDPFFVIATQNPADFHGTYPLPEAQLDRFLLRLRMGYPSEDEELELLFDRARADPLDAVVPAVDRRTLEHLRSHVRGVELSRDLARYAVRLSAATREHEDVDLGVSPRGTMALCRAAQAHALLAGRNYAIASDLQALAVEVLAHRVRTAQRVAARGEVAETVIRQALDSVAVPT